MAKNTQPIAKRCKALGISPAVMGYAKKNTTRNSNGNFRKKKSEYATQMQEKMKPEDIAPFLKSLSIEKETSVRASTVRQRRRTRPRRAPQAPGSRSATR